MIIDSIRQYSQTWWFRGFLFILALTLGFLWYGQDIITTTRGGLGAVANVGNSKITVADFSKAFHAQVSKLENEYNISLSAEQHKHLYPYIIQNLISEKLIEKEIERLKIITPDQTIRHTIVQETQFKDKEGNFDRKIFEAFLHNLGLKEETYVNLLRKELAKKNLLQSLFLNILPPKFLTVALYNYQNQRRTLSSVTIESQKIKIERSPTLQEVKTYFANNPSKFLRPEVRDISVLVFDYTLLKDQIKIPEEQLIQLYKNRSDEFSGKPFEEVKDQLKEDLLKQEGSEKMFEIVNKIDDAIAGGASLEEISKTYNISLSKHTQISKEGLLYPLNSGHPDTEVTLSSIDPKILQEAFKEKEQETTKVTETKEGKFFLAHIDKIYSARPLSFEESESEAKKFLIQELQEEKAKKIAIDIEQQVNQGAVFTMLARKENLQLTQFQVSRSAPLIPIAFDLPVNFIETLYTVPLKGAKAISYLDDKNHLSIIIGVVDKIDMPKEISNKESFSSFENQLKQDIGNTLYQEYLHSLKNIFPVSQNQQTLDRLISKSE